MKILLHAYKKDEVKTRLKDLIETEMLKVQIVQTNSQQHLSKTLCRPLHNFSALIAFIDVPKSISVLLPMKPLFENIKLILVFCKRLDGFNESALLLEPVYTQFPGSNFMDVISVLKRIEENRAGRSGRTIRNFR